MLFQNLIFLLLFTSFIPNSSKSSPVPAMNRQKLAASDQERQKFQSWKQRHKKTYKNKSDEDRAMANMIANMREIEAHNALYAAGKVTYTRAIWENSDLSFEEKKQLLIGLKVSDVNVTEAVTSKSGRLLKAAVPSSKFKAAPSEVNWVKAGLVDSIENQGKCGSCWSFTAAGVVEGALRKQGIKTRVSEQNLVDCSRNGNAGCDGGFTSEALRYILRNGIASYSDYPYTGRRGKCRASSMDKVPLEIGSVKYEKLRGNENRLRDIVANVGPVGVAIRAADSFMNYKSGVYNNPKCSRDLDHAVLLVGYGTDAKTGLDYWLVKNSWGTSWGEDGYVRMARNKNNQCGIAVEVSYILT